MRRQAPTIIDEHQEGSELEAIALRFDRNPSPTINEKTARAPGLGAIALAEGLCFDCRYA